MARSSARPALRNARSRSSQSGLMRSSSSRNTSGSMPLSESWRLSESVLNGVALRCGFAGLPSCNQSLPAPPAAQREFLPRQGEILAEPFRRVPNGSAIRLAGQSCASAPLDLRLGPDRCPTPQNKKGPPRRAAHFLFIPKDDWCGREDSNFHRCYPTATSTLRVYHSATTAHLVAPDPPGQASADVAKVLVNLKRLNQQSRLAVESLAAARGLAGDLHPQMPVIDIDFAMGDQRAIGIDEQRIVLAGVQLDHRAAPHAQQMVDRQIGGPQFNRDVHFNIV